MNLTRRMMCLAVSAAEVTGIIFNINLKDNCIQETKEGKIGHKVYNLWLMKS